MAQIKQIQLPSGQIYDIYDASAIHTLEDIAGLGLEGAFIFKGTVATVDALPTTEIEVGYVYHVTENDSEYVWTGSDWEEFGHHIVVDHTHNVTVTGTNSSSSVTGGATVTGSNAASDVTASGSVSVPKVTKSANYIKATSSIGDVAVGADGTIAAITGFGAHTTAAAVTELNTTTVKNPTATDVSIPNVTGNTTVMASYIENSPSSVVTDVAVTAGSAASWSASVDASGVLSFDFSTNVPTAVSQTTAGVQIKTATNTVLGDALSASKVTTDNVTVATGVKSTANAITELGVTTTANALAGVKVTTQPTLSVELEDATSSDGILVGDTVAVTSESKTVEVTGTAAAQTWTQNSGTITGVAAPATWTQGTGVTSQPIAE